MRKLFFTAACCGLLSAAFAQGPMFPWPGLPQSAEAFGLTFIGNTDQGTPSGGTCTVSGVSIGAADPTRQLVLAIGARFTTTGTTLSTVVEGSNSASLIANTDALIANNADNSLWIVSDSSAATTANITATYTGTVLRCSVSVYRIVGTGASVSGGNANTNTSGGATLSSSGLSIPAGGGAVGACTNFPSTTSANFSNMVTDTEHLVAGSTTFFMSGNNSSGSGATTFTCNFSPGSTDNLGSWATFNP